MTSGLASQGRSVLLTGGTGFVGSYIAANFLRRGDYIWFLVRAKTPEEERREFISARLKSIAGREALRWEPRWRVVTGDVTLPRLGLSHKDFPFLKERITDIFHTAANLSFKEKERESSVKTNIEGVHHVLQLAEEFKAKLHFISTAYVAGSRQGLIREEELDEGQRFNNVYEETKYEGEKLVRRWKELPGNQAIIYRPSIVTGDTTTGLAFAFNGYYILAKTVYDLGQWIEARTWRSILPVVIPVYRKAKLNFIPINDLANMIDGISRDERSVGKTFHVVHPNPPDIRVVFEESLHILGLPKGRVVFLPLVLIKIIVGAFKIISYPLGWRGRVFRRRVLLFLPYITSEIIFAVDNVRKILGNQFNIAHVDAHYLRKILRFAVKCNFGRHL